MKRPSLIFLVFFGLAILLALIGYVFRQELRTFLVEPIMNAFWKARQTWMGLEPEMVWGFFILIVILFILFAFPPVQRILESPFFKTIQGNKRFVQSDQNSQPRSLEGRLEFWLREVRQIYMEKYLARLVVVEIKKLILDQVAFRQRYPTRQEAERWLRENEADLPEEIWFLFNPKPPPESGWMSTSGRMSTLFGLGWLKRRFSIKQEAALPANAQNLDKIIQYLERKPEDKQ